MTKKVLITGGDGFIARSFKEYFSSIYDIHLCNRQKLDLSDTDKVYNYIKSNNFDVIIHTANHDSAPAFSTKDPNKVLENNLIMYFNIIRCKDYFGKMIYFGSGAEFGRENWDGKLEENYIDKYVPTNWPYGFSKYVMSKHTLLSKDIYNLRVFGLFGEYDDWRYRFISNICCKVVLNLPIIINKNVIFDHIYIHDLSEVVKWVIENNPKHNIYNTCSGKMYQYKDLANKLIKISDNNLDVIIKDEDLSIKCGGDNSSLLSEMGDFKFTSIDDSISKVYKWYDSNKSIIKEKLFEY